MLYSKSKKKVSVLGYKNLCNFHGVEINILFYIYLIYIKLELYLQIPYNYSFKISTDALKNLQSF